MIEFTILKDIKFSDYEDRIKLELKNRLDSCDIEYDEKFQIIMGFVTLIGNNEIILDMPANMQDNRYYHLAVGLIDRKSTQISLFSLKSLIPELDI